ncbi:NAD-dependent succinate-semialdehyde dehydrogenase [Litoribacter alkaliphilus]|uniref:NAD-dependent succinate-semialdehyde dehydrogenase n=1 Tax=Litoribacter ruber TaxID=702568 RepID=A0AAP2CHG5_9BACT|nr:NAD-dependent succinate-semialdehyde dehydrogenase [Litoribacter alkaliphilus]MBS9524788.1 NAD-dependent succinate-semialdehyde dehydrogenase [Litoribacter alkaliphilus]
MKSINPYTGETLKLYNPHSELQINEAITRAHDTYLEWRKTPFSEKSSLMNKAADILESKKDHYAKLISLEMGKMMKEAVAEIEKCAWVCRYYAEKAEGFLADTPLELPDDKKAKLKYNPLGVILAVMPWNFPFWQVFRFAAPNLMAGNTGLLKHASNVPQCALAIEEIFQEAGFPEGCFQSLLISSDKVKSILHHPHVKAATLTGSEKAGEIIASQAGEVLKKTVLELGGSDPFIVLADADVEKAAKTAAKARMINFGQSCIAAKRFIVHTDIYDSFVEIFKKEIENLKQGEQFDESADFCCMARPDLAAELYEQVNKSIEMGAKVILDGGRPEEGSALFRPYIISEITPEMPAYSEEMFGPVATIFEVNSEEEAIKIANDSPYGLGSSLWTSDMDKADTLAAQIESGAVFVNGLVASSPYLPFGGIKRSGYGRELAELGIKEFVNIKTVTFA